MKAGEVHNGYAFVESVPFRIIERVITKEEVDFLAYPIKGYTPGKKRKITFTALEEAMRKVGFGNTVYAGHPFKEGDIVSKDGRVMAVIEADIAIFGK